jgi:hypothetical protein
LIIEIQPWDLLDSFQDGNDIECARIAASQANLLQAFMAKHLKGMFSVRSGNYHVPWGPLLLRRVRRLAIMFNDKLVAEFDVTSAAKLLNVELTPVGYD